MAQEAGVQVEIKEALTANDMIWALERICNPQNQCLLLAEFNLRLVLEPEITPLVKPVDLF